MKKLVLIITMLLSTQVLLIKPQEKLLSSQAQVAFNQIKKIWNSDAKNIKDFNLNVINNGINKLQEDIYNIVQKNSTELSSSNITLLINEIKNPYFMKPSKPNMPSLSVNLPSAVARTISGIYHATKDFYDKLLQTQKIVENAKAEPELIGITTPYNKLADGILVIIKSTIEDRNKTLKR